MSRNARKLAFLHPKPGITAEQFRRYWREVHGPLVATSPGYAQWRRRYVQNHALGPGPIGSAFSGPGMAQFDLPGDVSNEAEYSTTTIYRERVRVDELRFIDMNGTFSMSATEICVQPGHGAAKVVALLGVADGLRDDVASVLRTWADDFLGATQAGALADGLVLDLVTPGTFSRPGARPMAPRAIDAVLEMWFASEQRLREALADAHGWRRFTDGGVIRSAESFVAEELVFFDGGPTALATAGGRQ